MDKIILGILLLRRMTAYEIKNVIKNNFKSMCSDSLGSIQAALKKLLELNMVSFEELVEKGVNKKRYSITDIGQKALIDWIKVPLNTSKTKNMDFAKLLFMGYVPKENRKYLINQIIVSLEKDYAALKSVKESINVEDERAALKNYLLTDKEYQKRIKALHKKNISESIEDIGTFTMAALDYGIDIAAFNIEWFKKLKKRI
ncbi:PadR family transcriptional regulator [Treponema sp. OMZ 792]|uniref:PadR family transcriptional regulator n=1 Tax=unclassified Treponema TaxID=2638727 RepID=UPI0020A607FA|nr:MULTISPECIES: PadR family transcriptional regulator [unclassified Treponema]UTC61667.1 PadR family transcriptional regulator [Treponema sp. OMZ 787]UTC76351.1 PadR family transcriptional regulator [Treponema sp. OMZ 792]UTC77770.1 PadR family transcriptional regulator [Treponema sp. OMZ 799]UTC80351.1 PadR family transcriptional regulator [Treponema sp. OMZ 798]